MAENDMVKCSCSTCGAKYRLPIEYQGRTARCKKCGNKFQVPEAELSLEDSVLTWLTSPAEDDVDEAVPEKPRIINMSSAHGQKASEGGADSGRAIPMKQPKSGTA